MGGASPRPLICPAGLRPAGHTYTSKWAFGPLACVYMCLQPLGLQAHVRTGTCGPKAHRCPYTCPCAPKGHRGMYVRTCCEAACAYTHGQPEGLPVCTYARAARRAARAYTHVGPEGAHVCTYASGPRRGPLAYTYGQWPYVHKYGPAKASRTRLHTRAKGSRSQIINSCAYTQGVVLNLLSPGPQIPGLQSHFQKEKVFRKKNENTLVGGDVSKNLSLNPFVQAGPTYRWVASGPPIPYGRLHKIMQP